MATPHKDSTTKGGALQYQRLTPLGRAGLSALGLGLASPAPKAPAKPDSGPSYAAVTVQSESEKTKEKTNFQVDFDDGESCGGVVRAMHYVEGVLHAVVAFADSDVYSLRVQQCRECLEFLSSS